MSIKIAYQEVPANAENPVWTVTNGRFSADMGIGTSEYASSSVYSQKDGDYPFTEPLTITASFGNEPLFKGFSVGFSSTAYCTRIKVTFTSGQVTHSEVFRPISGAYAYYSRALPTPYTSITFEFLGANAPNATIITDFFQLGQVTMFTGADLIGFPQITQEACPVGTELPFDTSEIKLFLPDGAPRFQRWDRYTIMSGSAPIARHYIDTVERDGNIYAVKGISIVGVLADMDYDGFFLDSGTISTVNMLRSVANNTAPGYANSVPEVAQFIVDSSFDDDGEEAPYPYPGEYRGNLPPGPRRDALHRVVQALGALLQTLPNGRLQLLPCPSGAGNATSIPTSAIFAGSVSLQRKTPYSSLSLSTYTHTADAETTIWSGTIPAGTFRIVFSAPCYITSVTEGVTLTMPSGSTYAWWATIMASSTTAVTVTGIPLKAVENVNVTTYTTDAGAVENPLTISGNDFYLYDGPNGAANGNALNGYYSSIRQNAELTFKMACSSVVPEIGSRYSVELASGTMTGWATKIITTLSNANRYAEVTLTGIWEDAE